MRVFVTGGSGYIGSAVVGCLSTAGHQVSALARSNASAERLARLGCEVLIGDMRDPKTWIGQLGACGAIVHTAATFDDDMAAAEATLLDALLDYADRHLVRTALRLRFVYTGGCWLYGAVGDNAAVEGSPFDPLPAFAYMVTQRARLLEAPQLSVSVVHPAIVWDEDGGAVARFAERAGQGAAPIVVGSLNTRWPLVHRDDLAQLYRLVVETGLEGADYHGVAETGVRVGDIAARIAAKLGAPRPVEQPLAEAVTELGHWAEGLALDQTMDAPLTRRQLGWRPSRPGILASI